MRVEPPQTESELLERARAIAGQSLRELTGACGGSAVPEDLRRHKGWVGELLERALGASAGSQPKPDFPDLGIELKTVPVRGDGYPLESTHVCTVPLSGTAGLRWTESLVRRKLARVLWIPIQGDTDVPLESRRIGMPLLWSPTPPQERQLEQDWEELMHYIGLGDLDQISASHGNYLQIRPKAADGAAMTETVGPDGVMTAALPRGFYLRASFTAEIIRTAYLLPSSRSSFNSK